MVVLITILSLILLLLLWLLFVPFYIRIDTISGRYEFYQPVSFGLLYGEHGWTVRVLGINMQAKPSPDKKPEQPTPGKTGEARRKKNLFARRSFASWCAFVTRIVKSFHVRQLDVDLDTGDVVVNAQLVPVMLLLSRDQVSLRTNFDGRVSARVLVWVRLSSLVWAFILFTLNK